MAYGLKWKIPFVNDNGKKREIKILVDGYSGASVVLEGGDSPISTQESTDADMLCPIRTQTGYIRVIDNGDLDGLTPTSNTQHKVVLVDENGGTLWIGYMKAAEYSATWAVNPDEVQLPIISRVEALGCIDMDSTKEMSMTTFAELIAEAADAIGDVSEIWIPAEYENDNAGDYWIPLKLTLSRANFFKKVDADNYDDPDYKEYECDSYMDMLEKICKLFGWSLHERGKRWILSSATTRKYFKLTVAQMAAIASVTSCNVEEVDGVLFDSLNAVGIDHKRDILQGCRTFQVEANVNDESDWLPQLKKSDFKPGASSNVDDTYIVWREDTQENTYYCRHGWVGYINSRRYTFHRYIKNNEGTYQERNWKIEGVPSIWNDKYTNALTADYGYMDFFKESDKTDGTKKSYSYNEGILLSTSDESESIVLRSLVMLSVRGNRISNIYGGALVWNPTIVYPYEGDETKDKVKQIYIRVRVGNMYWSGSAWRSQVSWARVDFDDDGVSPIDQKTLSMPYNDAKGYIMPISGVMSGEIEISIAAVNCTYTDIILIKEADLEYVKEDGGESNDKSKNNYYAANTLKYKDRKKVSLEVASDNNNKPGFGILYMNGDKVDDSTFDGGRPEIILLGKLKSIFGRNIEKLTLNVEANDTIQPMARIVKDGVHYQVLSESRDWMADESTLICESLPSGQ